MKDPNFFAGGGFDRAGLKRADPDWVARALASADTRVIPVWRDQHLVTDAEDPSPVFLTAGEVEALGAGGPGPTLLGIVEDRTVFAVDVSHVETADTHEMLGGRGAFIDIRDVGSLLAREHAQMMAMARALLYWHRRHGYCGACGAPTEPRDAGHVRVCTNSACGITHFPRTDAAVIMLVTDGDRCLLGRRPGRQNVMYSTLAGFVEPGESLEEAVAREVMEEVGIVTINQRYAHSQPWPFPSQLMVGFYADAVTREIILNRDELADAGWFTRDEVRRMMEARNREEAEARGLRRLPRPVSIARRLIADWLQGRTE